MTLDNWTLERKPAMEFGKESGNGMWKGKPAMESGKETGNEFGKEFGKGNRKVFEMEFGMEFGKGKKMMLSVTLR